MYVVEGRTPGIEASRAALEGIYRLVEDTATPAVWVWQPERQVAFGPRDVAHGGYSAAVEAARDRGYEPVERTVGGHPVAHTGSTLAFARAVPIEDPRRGLSTRYDAALAAVDAALADLGVAVERGEPAESFCPGQHSLSANGKVVGLAQRVTGSFAVVSGVAVVSDPAAVADVLLPVYKALSLPFDPTTVGSIADAGGPAEPAAVAEAIESALIGDHRAESITLERLRGHP